MKTVVNTDGFSSVILALSIRSINSQAATVTSRATISQLIWKSQLTQTDGTNRAAVSGGQAAAAS